MTNELVITETAGFRIGKGGEIIIDSMADFTPEQLNTGVAHLAGIGVMAKFALARLVLTGENLFGDDVYGMPAVASINPSYLKNLLYVARNVPPHVVRPNVSFSVHQEVAKLPPDQQETWLKSVEENGWTRDDVRDMISGRAGEPSQEDEDDQNVRQVALIAPRNARDGVTLALDFLEGRTQLTTEEVVRMLKDLL